MIKNNKRQKSSKWIVGLVVVFLLAAAGGGYLWWNQATTVSAKTTNANTNTTQVRRGTISLTASGTGSVVTNQKASLSFSTAGVVTKIHVQAGDKVTQGQVLAEIGDTQTQKTALNTAELNLAAANKNLNDLLSGSAAALSNAQLSVVSAQKAYADAKSGVIQPGAVRCNQDTLDAYYTAYMREVDQLERLGDGGGSTEYHLTQIVPQRNRVAQAKAKYDYCAGFTTYEIESSQATLVLKQAALADAQAALNKLQANQGIDPDKKAELQNKVDSAQIALDKAKNALAGTVIKAPSDGVILTVAGQPGDNVGTGIFITLADLDRPLVEFAVDESDLDMVAVGYQAEVTFDALPNQVFTGKVLRIYPTLSTAGNYQVIKGLIQLDPSTGSAARTLPVGLNASVSIINQKAENVLLVPIEALRDLGSGQYGVFTVTSSGELTLIPVKVGLKSTAFAEIQEGLTLSSVVSTGKMETK